MPNQVQSAKLNQAVSSILWNSNEIAEFTSILQRVNEIAGKNSQIVTETSILHSANEFADSQEVTECLILQSDNEFAEPFTQMDTDPTIVQNCDEIEELNIEESTIPQNSSHTEYTPNGVDVVVRTPGGTYTH